MQTHCHTDQRGTVRMSIQDQRALAALMSLRTFITHVAVRVAAELGVDGSAIETEARTQEFNCRRSAPRFASCIRISGLELYTCGKVGSWRAMTHIEELPEYTTLAEAKRVAEGLFNHFASQSREQHLHIIEQGEYPFVPRTLTILDQFGYAIARMESHQDDGRYIACWIGIAPADVQSAITDLRQRAQELQAQIQALRRDGAASVRIAELRQLAEGHRDRASILEFSPLVAG